MALSDLETSYVFSRVDSDIASSAVNPELFLYHIDENQLPASDYMYSDSNGDIRITNCQLVSWAGKWRDSDSKKCWFLAIQDSGQTISINDPKNKIVAGLGD